jgi:hypothetical protein
VKELGVGAAISLLVEGMATVRLAPSAKTPLLSPTTPRVTVSAPSVATVTNEKEKAKLDALAKLNVLAPLTRVTAMLAAHHLSHSEWLRYRLMPACILNSSIDRQHAGSLPCLEE